MNKLDLFHFKFPKFTRKQDRKNMKICKRCGKEFDQKQRFIFVLKYNPKDNYREMLEMGLFCSNRCQWVEKNWNVLKDWYLKS